MKAVFTEAIKDPQASLLIFREKNEGTNVASDGQMSFSFQEPADFLSVGLSYGEENTFVFYTGEALSEKALLSEVRKLAMHGVTVFGAKKYYGDFLFTKTADTEHVFDALIAAYLCNPLKNDYTIEDLSAEYCNQPLEQYHQIFGKMNQKSAYEQQKQKLSQYITRNAYVLYMSAPLLRKRLQEMQMETLFQTIEMPLSYVLYSMEQEGILVKKQALADYGEKLQVRIEELEKAIHEEAKEEFNINSPKQLGEILFEKMGLPGGKKTKTGYSTAADILEKLALDYPFVANILEYRALTKLKSTYADGLAAFIAEDGRIHTNYHQTITATGRISSTEPNLQNIPMRTELGRMIRKVFVPKTDCVFVDADYSQIELRILAHMSGDETLIEAYNTDADIHRLTASQVFHTPFEEVTDLQRRNAKAVNFGIVYGISPFGLSQDLSISVKEAKQYIEQYYKTYPEIKTFLDRLINEAKETGYATTMFGRKRPVPELKSSNFMQKSFGERVAMNAPIQGTAADIMKIAMIHVFERLQEEHMQSKMILQIHDELVIETVKEEKETVMRILTEEMMKAANLRVRLEVDAHAGNDWYEAK